MAIADVAVSTAAKEEAVTTDLSFRFVFFGLALLSVIMLAARAYQGAYAWETGLDSFHPDFHKYWMNLFYAEIIIVPLVAGCLWTWQWRTRDRHPEQMTAREFSISLFGFLLTFSHFTGPRVSFRKVMRHGTKRLCETQALHRVTSCSSTLLSRPTLFSGLGHTFTP